MVFVEVCEGISIPHWTIDEEAGSPILPGATPTPEPPRPLFGDAPFAACRRTGFEPPSRTPRTSPRQPASPDALSTETARLAELMPIRSGGAAVRRKGHDAVVSSRHRRPPRGDEGGGVVLLDDGRSREAFAGGKRFPGDDAGLDR